MLFDWGSSRKDSINEGQMQSANVKEKQENARNLIKEKFRLFFWAVIQMVAN